MTLQQLEYLIAVDRFRHFGKAADYCNVTQPTLSAMIQKLEEELGVKLLDRSLHPLEPTPTGQLVLEQAKKALLSSRRIKDIVSEQRDSIEGTFNLGIIPTIAPYLIPRFFPQLANKHPEMDVRITDMKTEDIKEAIRKGDIDAGIVADLDGMDDFEKTGLYYEELFVYVSPEDKLISYDKIKDKDLNGEFLWLLGEGHCLSQQMQKFCNLKHAEKSERAYRLGSLETFMRMVEGGRGVTFIPELAVKQLTEDKRKLVRSFAIPTPTRRVIIITRKNFIRESLLKLITGSIMKSIPADMLRQKPHQQKV
jgi:LysR family hydrogen peroxide-inducible transcriptional activator